MRHRGLVLAALALFACGAVAPARANVLVTIDKSAQQMTVAVDGVPRWRWPVSTGRPGYDTPSGSFKAFRMEADHYSKEWDDAPMPYSIFFTKAGHAIHGYLDTRRIGSPASHGCIRLNPENAAKLYALVEEQGVLNTTVVLTGDASIALGRRGVPRAQPAAADVAMDARTAGRPLALQPSYDDRYPQYQQLYRPPRPAGFFLFPFGSN